MCCIFSLPLNPCCIVSIRDPHHLEIYKGKALPDMPICFTTLPHMLQEIEKRLMGSREGSSRHSKSNSGSCSTSGKESPTSQAASASPRSPVPESAEDSAAADKLFSNCQHSRDHAETGNGQTRYTTGLNFSSSTK